MPAAANDHASFTRELGSGYTYLNQIHEKFSESSPIPNECVRKPLNGAISFKTPEVIKGAKQISFKNIFEKNLGGGEGCSEER